MRTIYLMLILSIFDNYAIADSLLDINDFKIPNEKRHQWINEKNGRVGIVNISGSLVSSPCSLGDESIISKGFAIIDLIKCGDGDLINIKPYLYVKEYSINDHSSKLITKKNMKFENGINYIKLKLDDKEKFLGVKVFYE